MILISNDSGSCNQSTDLDDETCVPVIGHIAAIIQRGASYDSIVEAKSGILHNIQAVTTTNQLTQRVQFVGEHENPYQQLQSTRNFENDSTVSSSNTALALAFVAIAIVFGVVATLYVIRTSKESRSYHKEVGIVSTAGHTDRETGDELFCGFYGGSGGSKSSDNSIPSEYPSKSDEYESPSTGVAAVYLDEDAQSSTKSFHEENSDNNSFHSDDSFQSEDNGSFHSDDRPHVDGDGIDHNGNAMNASDMVVYNSDDLKGLDVTDMVVYNSDDGGHNSQCDGDSCSLSS